MSGLNLDIGNFSLSSRGNLASKVLSILRRDGNYLFAAKEASSLFSTTTGTTAAVLDGTVARWNDMAGSAVNLQQATAGYQPRLRYVDGVWYIDFDGTDDLLTLPAQSGVSAATLIYSVKGVGHLTYSGQALTSAKTINTDNLCGLIVCRTAPSAADLALLERYADSLAGGVQTLGPELVTNGVFDADSGWNKNSVWTISGGVASCSASTININQNIVVSAGKTYKIEFDATITSGSIRAELTSVNGATLAATGRYKTYITATLTGTHALYTYGVTTFTGSIDNISVREVIFT